MWARIKNNKVVEITNNDPVGRFHSSLSFAECDETVRVGYMYVDGVFSSAPFDAESALKIKLAEIVSGFKAAMSPITANYTSEDIASFSTQQAEAKDWQADNNADTPLLEFMVANRPSVDKATLVSRILSNSVLYKQVAGPAIGKKQHFEDLLYALKAQHEDPNQPDATQADFDAIVVDFS